jgi:hypothetical protein
MSEEDICADYKQKPVQTPFTTRSPRRSPPRTSTRRMLPSRLSRWPVRTYLSHTPSTFVVSLPPSEPLSLVTPPLHPNLKQPIDMNTDANNTTDKKAREEMAGKAKGKGPMNTGQQGIKKSGKK